MSISKKIKTIIFGVILMMFACAALSACGDAGTYATQKNFITIGCVCPLSGELAGFGEGSLEMEEAAVKTINENGGVYIDTLERKLKLRFVIADSASTEAGARAAAEKLIGEEHVDLMICSSGAETALPVAGVCEEKKIPFFSMNCENDIWVASGAHNYAFNCGVDHRSRLNAFYDVWQEKEIESIGLLATPSEDAERFAAGLTAFCEEKELKLTDPGRLDLASGKFGAQVRTLSKAKVKAVICYMSPEEFSTLWAEGSLRLVGYDMCILVNDHFLMSETEKIVPGAEIKEFYTATCWDKTYPFTSSLTDEENVDIARFWDDHFLSQSAEITGLKHANVELAVSAVKLAMALDADTIRSAAKSLNENTVLGLVDYDETNNSSVLPCSVLKWTYEARTASWTKELISHKQLGEDVVFEEDD